jgi:nitrile hydratase
MLLCRMPHDHDENHAHHLLPAEPALRVKALETILVEKGLLDQQAVDAIIDEYEQRIGPHIGAKLVARAWNDPLFKSMLVLLGDRVSMLL